MSTIPIFCYHAVAAGVTGPHARFAVHPLLFARHLDAFSAAGLTFLTFSCAVQLLQRGDVPKRVAVLTFDDGFADAADVVAPMLAERGMVATAFVPTGYLPSSVIGRPRQMDRARILDLLDAGWEIGSHGHSHVSLDVMAPDDIRGELTRSKVILEDLVQKEVRSIAYPFGRCSARVRTVAGETGYRAGCIVNHALASQADHPLAFSRLRVLAASSENEVAAWLAGRDVRRSDGSERPVTRAYRIVRRVRSSAKWPVKEGLA